MSDSGSSNKVSRRNAPIAELGLGHVRLPKASGLAELERNVIGADDDPSKVALKLGWFPRTRLDDGLVKTIADFEFLLQRGFRTAPSFVEGVPTLGTSRV